MSSRGELQNKLTEILSKDGIAEELKKAASAEDVQNILKENGLDISSEDLLAVMEQMMSAGNDKELDVVELEDVSGGALLIPQVWKVLWKVLTKSNLPKGLMI